MNRIDRPRPHLGFTGNRLVRDGENRTSETLRTALAHKDAKVFVFANGQWLCRGSALSPEPLFTPAEAARLGAAPDHILLGHTADGAPHLACALPAEAAGVSAGPATRGIPADLHTANLRTLAMQALLDPDLEGQLATAQHLLNWHDGARFCGRCGSPTVSEAGGFRRRCTGCGHVVFPRTDPVSIMLVHDGEGNCLLGRSPRFEPGMWSCLAGFVEAGETLEDAVRRETLEEAGIAVGSVRYHSSQPWPFPGSLMIGCIAEALDRDIVFDRVELEDCRWFARAEARAMLDETHEGGLTVPPEYAIAHHLIRWFASNAD